MRICALLGVGTLTAGCGGSGRAALISLGMCEVVSATVMMPRAATELRTCLNDCMPFATERVFTLTGAFSVDVCNDAMRSRIICDVCISVLVKTRIVSVPFGGL